MNHPDKAVPKDMDYRELTEDFLENTVEPVWISYRPSVDDPARLQWVNDAFCRYFGFDRDAVLGEDVRLIHDPDHYDEFVDNVRKAVATHECSFAVETRCRNSEGTPRWAHIAFFMIPDRKGTGRRSVCTLRDIDELMKREAAATRALTEHERLYRQLEAMQVRLLSAINTMRDPFAIFDDKNRLVIWNAAYAESSADRPEDLVEGMPMEDVLRLAVEKGLYPEAKGQVAAWVKKQISDVDTYGRKAETIILVGIGQRKYRVHRNRAANGDFVILRSDVTELVRQQQKLEEYAERLEEANAEISHQAMHDDLTGLGNRRYLGRKLDDMIAERAEKGGEIAALHIDLDRFKQINDTIGHSAGDYLLQGVARILRDLIGPEEFAARIGGDEFVVLMRCCENDDAPERLAQEIVARCAEPMPFESRQCRYGASVGIARTPLIAAPDLITSADVALYKAKHNGRSRAERFDKLDLEKMRRTKEIADDILRGLERSEFEPWYQPQIDARTGEIVGFEALARWYHPEMGVLVPDVFLATASDMQVDWRIDAMIFEKAMDQCGGLFADEPEVPSLSFNVSIGRILDDAIFDSARVLNAYPGEVAFELLETIFLEEESDAFLMRVDTLREMGVGLEVDDFGSGRASVIALKRLAPDRLKIDRRLIQPITESESARQLVRSMVEIGRALEIKVTAEGVETAEHVRHLARLGCDRLQGYYYARPAPFDEIKEIYAGDRRLPRCG